MPDLTEVTGTIPASTARRRAEEILRDKMESDSQNSLAFVLDRWSDFGRDLGFDAALSNLQPDPGFELDDERMKALTEGIDTDLIPLFARAHSDEHAFLIRGQLLEQQARREEIARMGARGTALSLLAGITDPTSVLAGLATGGLGSAVAAAGRMGRLGSLAARGLITGGAFAGLEYEKSRVNPSIGGVDIARQGVTGAVLGGLGGDEAVAALSRPARFAVVGGAAAGAGAAVDVPAFLSESLSGRDVVYNMALNFGLNGVMAAIPGAQARPETALRRGMAEAGARVKARIEREDAVASGATITEKGGKHFSSIDERAGSEADIASIQARMTDDPVGAMEDLADLATIGKITIEAEPRPTKAAVPTESLGAATAAEVSANAARQTETPDFEIGDFQTDGIFDERWSAMKIKGAGFSIRIDPGHLPGTNESARVRLAANLIFGDNLPKWDGSPSREAGLPWVERTAGASTAEYFNTFDAAYGSHKKNARAAGKKPMSVAEFDTAVTRASRRFTDTSVLDPDVKKAADAFRALHKKGYELARRHNAEGFDNFEHDPNHASRVYDREAVAAAVRAHGASEVVRLFSEAVQRHNPDVPGNVARRVAEAIVKRAALASHRQGFADLMDITGAAGRDRLVESLSELGLPASAIDEIAGHVFQSKDPAGRSAVARRRIGLDETHEITTRAGRLALEDLLENSSQVLALRYARATAGAAALARIYERLTPVASGDAPARRPPSTPAALRKILEDEASTLLGVETGQLDQARLTRDLDIVEAGLRLVAGEPLWENTRFDTALRVIRNMNVGKLLSGAGTAIQNFGEFFQVLSENGPAAVARQFPDVVASFFNRDADGNIATPLLRDLEHWTGLGTDFTTRRVLSHADPSYEVGQIKTGPVERFSARFARIGTSIGGLAHAQTALERIAAASIAQKWWDAARSGSLKLSEKRLASMGLTADEASRILPQLREHGEKLRGMFGPRLGSLNLHKWASAEDASLFLDALTKTARRQVLKPGASDLPLWMHSGTARVFTQLRTFALGAWVNKALYGLKMNDVTAYTAFAMEAVGASILYGLRTYLDSAGKPDRERYLRERLAPKAILAAGISRSAWASVLPMGFDTVWSDLLGHEPVFSPARSTGLQGGLFEGTATGNWVQGVGRSIKSSRALFDRNYTFSKRDARALRDALWAPRVTGIYNVLDQLMSRLPNKSTADEK